MEGHEKSGGFMFARTYAELAAVLPDEEAGRILKGLICEFWGCGEKVDVSESPLVVALYNSIVQTAKEIDDNYQAQRERKREAGRKGAEATNKKFAAAAAVPDSAELNESKENKSNENKNKENKTKESKESKKTEPPAADTAPPSAALTEQQKNILIDRYGRANVEAYEQRYDKWRSSKPVCKANAFVCISNWLKQDKAEEKAGCTGSLLAENVEKAVIEKYRRLKDS